MKRLIDNLRKSSFLRHNAIFFVGSVAVGVLNYVYYPVLGRLLDIESYGEVQALVSLFLQMTIFLTVLSQVTVNIVANYEDEEQKRRAVFELEKLALLFFSLLFVVVLLFGWKLKSFFNFASVWPFIILMLALVSAVPLTFRSAFLRAHQKFAATSAANLIAAGAKLLFSATLVVIGWQTVGAIFGIVLAQILAFGYAVLQARKVGFAYPEGASWWRRPDVAALRPELKYALLVLCGSLIVTILSSIDIFVVKHFFSAQVAGQYAGVSTVARMIFFLTASVSQVLLPSVKVNLPAKQNRQFLLKSLALVVVLGGSACLVFGLFSHQIVTLFMGHAYARYAHLLTMLSLTMFIVSVLNLVISYYIALRRYQISGIVVAGALVTGALLILRHTTLDAVVSSLLYGSFIMLAMLALWRLTLFYKMRNQHVQA